ncbi:hypothetical protein [Streptomyces sp. NPDC088789]|uniref:hypothetical protein n=1 Tax=Streptomyces sp. NPDC088789 TaxID=3365899 RepID=UPI0037F69331
MTRLSDERSAARERVVRARDEVIYAYRDEGASLNALARQYGVTTDWLQGRLIAWYVPLRTRSEAASLQWQQKRTAMQRKGRKQVPEPDQQRRSNERRTEVGRKKTTPTVRAVKADAIRVANGALPAPDENQAAAGRRALMREVGNDQRRERARDRVQMEKD